MSTDTAPITDLPQAYLDEYLRLCSKFPLRPIRTRPEWHAATAVMDPLAVLCSGEASDAQRDYLAVLTDLVEAAEQELFAEDLAELRRDLDAITGTQRLQHGVERLDVSVDRLAAVLEVDEETARSIMRGYVPLSPAQVKIASKFFDIREEDLLKT